MKKNERGFTLIELMVVVAIIGILATVAYPSYIAYVQKGHQREGQGDMLALGAQLERYRSRHFSYQGATIAGLRANMANSDHYTYTLNITNANQRFEITATPKGGMMSGTEVMRLNERGETCWKKGGCVISTDPSWQETP